MLTFIVPTLATVAFYLPGGILMPVRIASLLLAAVAVWQLVREPRLLRSPVLLVAGGASAVMVIFGLLGIARFGGHASSLIQWGFALLLVCTMAVLGRDRTLVRAFLWGWLCSAALAASVGFWEIITARHLPGNGPAREFVGVVPGWNVISSFFDNPNLFAYFCVVALLLVPLGARMLGGRAWVGAWGLAAALAVLLWHTEGRLAFIAAAVGLLIWAMRARWSRWVAAAGAAGLVGTAILRIPPGAIVVDAAYQVLENLQWGELKSSGARLEIMRTGWWMTERSDYLGVGPGNFPNWAKSPENPFVSGLSNPHFGLVELMAEYGVVTLTVFVALLCLGAFACLRAAADRSRPRTLRAVALAGLALTVTMPILSATHSSWLGQPLTAVHIATIGALLAVLDARSRQP